MYAPERMLTNAHVVAGTNKVTVQVVGDRAVGRDASWSMTPSATSPCCDVPG